MVVIKIVEEEQEVKEGKDLHHTDQKMRLVIILIQKFSINKKLQIISIIKTTNTNNLRKDNIQETLTHETAINKIITNIEHYGDI